MNLDVLIFAAHPDDAELSMGGTIAKLSLDNLHIPDGNIKNDQDNLMKIIMAIRKYRPKVIFAPYFNDRHPDHINTGLLVKQAMFYTGLQKIKTFDHEKCQDAYRPKKLYYYMQTYTFEPSFIVDISATHELKMKAVKAYETQFFNPKSKEPDTFISTPEFINFIESRGSFYGFKIGRRYGEPFLTEEGVELDMNHLIKSGL